VHEDVELHEPRDDASSSVLPALAEVHRRAGRPDEAEQVARRGLEFEPEGADARLVLALALLDQGRSDEARSVLEPLAATLLSRHGLESGGAPAPVAEPEPEDTFLDAELEQAFEAARPEREHMIDADSVAQQAIRSADRELAREFGLEGSLPATRTVADLLESQGDPDAARQIRQSLPAPAAPQPEGPEAVIVELERWIQNLRRPRA
jgi:tetratricopeptide (TPR) repeat protein